MPLFQFNNIRISGIACAVPATVVKVSDFAGRFGEEYCHKFSEVTGIREFRKTREHQTTSDLCFAAAENLLSRKHIERQQIGASRDEFG